MLISEKSVVLKNGSRVVLKSPCISDARDYINLIYVTNNETHFMKRSPSETISPDKVSSDDIKKEEEWIKSTADSPVSFNITAWAEGKLIGSGGVVQISPYLKLKHRGGFGVSIIKDWCDKGLGSIITKECIEQARANGFEQVELSVYSDNPRAKHVYEKLGFKECGCIPHGFKTGKDEYADEVMMIYMM